MDIWRALKYLYPNAKPTTPFEPGDYKISDEADGQGPRIVEWNLPGSPPTRQQIIDAIAAYDAAQQQAQQDVAALRTLIINTAQSAVGLAFNALTANQVRALLACLLHKNGALNKDGIVRPLTDWL